jgi:Na+/H+ antiporter NhaB
VTRPLNGFLITLALRPCCSWAWARFGKRWLLIPVMVPVSLLLSYGDLMGVDRFVLACGLPGVTREFWIGIFFMRAATFMIWLLLYFGIKSQTS